MAYKIHCDWCGERLRYEDDQAVMPVTIHHRRGRGTHDAKWAEETKITRHFCAAGQDTDLDRHGRNRMGLVPDPTDLDSCYERAMATITGTELSDPGAGLEWRLVRADGGDSPKVSEPSSTPAGPIEGNLAAVLALLPRNGTASAVRRAGITSLEQVAEMSDLDLCELPGIGPRIVHLLRRAIADQGIVASTGSYSGEQLANDVYDLIRTRMPQVGLDDPLRATLERTMPALGEALGMPVDEAPGSEQKRGV